MTDPIALLQRAAEEAAADPRLEPDPVAAVRGRVDRRRTGRRVRRVAVAAAVVLLAGVAVAVTTQGDDDREGVVVAPPPGPTTDPASPPERDVPPSPLRARSQPAVAGVGDEVVVWGGLAPDGAPLADGAVYDRTSREWRLLPPGPFAGRPEDIASAPGVAAPVAGGVVVARGTDVARWDQATDTWTDLADAPAPVTRLVPGGAGRLVDASIPAVLDVEADTWEQPVAGPPYAVDVTAQVWTGAEVLAFGTSPDGDPGRITVIGFDPEAVEWRDIPEAPPTIDVVGGLGVGAAWDGERVIVTDDEMRAAAYDPVSGEWEPLPDVPARFAEHHPSSASVGGRTTTSTAWTLAVLDADRQGWTPFPSPNPSDGGGPPGQWLVALDDHTIGSWVDDAGPALADLILLDPTTLAEHDRRRQVGAVSVTLGPDDEVTAATTADGLVVLSIAPAERGPCQVTSGFSRPPGTEEERAVEEEVRGLGGPKTWFHDTAGTHWETEVGDQDLVTIECRDPAAARRLVGSMVLTTPR